MTTFKRQHSKYENGLFTLFKMDIKRNITYSVNKSTNLFSNNVDVLRNVTLLYSMFPEFESRKDFLTTFPSIKHFDIHP